MTTRPKKIEPMVVTRPRIVIVDDEQSILYSLRSLLRRQHYDLHCFERGSEAVEYITHNTPDIIISDMRMPEMNGMEFLDQASFICPTATRLMLSGYEEKGTVFDIIAHGVAQQFIMKPWEDEQINAIIENAIRMRQELQKQHLDEMLLNVSSLASPPEAQKQLQRLLANETRSIKELASAVEKVPALVARILRIANSVYHSARIPISTTIEAVSFIGAEYVESLILAMSIVHHTEEKLVKEFAAELDDLWQHALSRAELGRSIAEQWPGFKQPAIAYTVCLLQDIGFLIRFNTDPEKSRQLVQVTKLLHLTMHEAESKIFTISHTAVGAALLRLWNFPDAIVSAIASHHSETHGDHLTQIAQIADIVESGEQARPHDRQVNPLIKEWMTKN